MADRTDGDLHWVRIKSAEDDAPWAQGAWVDDADHPGWMVDGFFYVEEEIEIVGPAIRPPDASTALIDRAREAIRLGAMTGADGLRRKSANIYVIADELVEALTGEKTIA